MRREFVTEIFEWLWRNPTRATGVAAYGLALACCVFAWSRAKGDATKSRFAALLMVCDGLLLLDMVFNVRWILHQFFMDEATVVALYASRRGPQTLVLVALAGVFLFGLRVVSQKLRGRNGAVLAVSGALLSVTLWCAEVVSLHAVDHILYRPIGSLMTVSFLWIFAGMMTSIGVLVESKTVWKGSRVYPD
jgi:hypothetical protein